jgi:hypothetical protein
MFPSSATLRGGAARARDDISPAETTKCGDDGHAPEAGVVLQIGETLFGLGLVVADGIAHDGKQDLDLGAGQVRQDGEEIVGRLRIRRVDEAVTLSMGRRLSGRMGSMAGM